MGFEELKNIYKYMTRINKLSLQPLNFNIIKKYGLMTQQNKSIEQKLKIKSDNYIFKANVFKLTY